MATQIANFMPPRAHRSPAGHFHNSPRNQRLQRKAGLQTCVATIVCGDGFRTNTAKQRRNVHDRD
jgi:hypothetical protein